MKSLLDRLAAYLDHLDHDSEEIHDLRADVDQKRAKLHVADGDPGWVTCDRCGIAGHLDEYIGSTCPRCYDIALALVDFFTWMRSWSFCDRHGRPLPCDLPCARCSTSCANHDSAEALGQCRGHVQRCTHGNFTDSCEDCQREVKMWLDSMIKRPVG